MLCRYFSILAWRILWAEEPGGLQAMVQKFVPPFESWLFWSINSQSVAHRIAIGPNISLYLPTGPREVLDTGRY